MKASEGPHTPAKQVVSSRRREKGLFMHRKSLPQIQTISRISKFFEKQKTKKELPGHESQESIPTSLKALLFWGNLHFFPISSNLHQPCVIRDKSPGGEESKDDTAPRRRLPSTADRARAQCQRRTRDAHSAPAGPGRAAHGPRDRPRKHGGTHEGEAPARMTCTANRCHLLVPRKHQGCEKETN